MLDALIVGARKPRSNFYPPATRRAHSRIEESARGGHAANRHPIIFPEVSTQQEEREKDRSREKERLQICPTRRFRLVAIVGAVFHGVYTAWSRLQDSAKSTKRNRVSKASGPHGRTKALLSVPPPPAGHNRHGLFAAARKSGRYAQHASRYTPLLAPACS